MGYLAFAAVLVSMIFTILFPERMRDILYFRIPREWRPDMSADMRVPCISLLVFSTFFFSYVHMKHAHLFMRDPRSALPGYCAGVVFAALGLFLCVKPVRGLKQFIQPLRGIPDASIERTHNLVLGARVVGVVSIVGSAYWLSRIFS